MKPRQRQKQKVYPERNDLMDIEDVSLDCSAYSSRESSEDDLEVKDIIGNTKSQLLTTSIIRKFIKSTSSASINSDTTMSDTTSLDDSSEGVTDEDSGLDDDRNRNGSIYSDSSNYECDSQSSTVILPSINSNMAEIRTHADQEVQNILNPTPGEHKKEDIQILLPDPIVLARSQSGVNLFASTRSAGPLKSFSPVKKSNKSEDVLKAKLFLNSPDATKERAALLSRSVGKIVDDLAETRAYIYLKGRRKKEDFESFCPLVQMKIIKMLKNLEQFFGGKEKEKERSYDEYLDLPLLVRMLVDQVQDAASEVAIKTIAQDMEGRRVTSSSPLSYPRRNIN